MEIQLTAREMFEKYGYTLYDETDEIIFYCTDYDSEMQEDNQYIKFDKICKTIYSNKEICIKELEMINKQVEELWGGIMKNKEIEELLNKMKNCNGVFDYYLEYGEVDLLLSYIEQLEKRNKELYEGFMATQEELTNYAIENEQLEADYKEANESIIWWTNRFNAVERDKKQLENNRDKALKIIDSYELGKYDYSIPAGGIIALREVLKNETNERNVD